MNKMKNWILTITALLSVIAVAVTLSSGCSSTPPVVDGPEDSTGDLFDKNGMVVTGNSYLDITAVDVRKDGDQYIFLMKLLGDVPAKTPKSSTSIEWDFMIDADRNIFTGATWSLAANNLGFDLIANNIGYEYVVSLILTNNTYTYQIYDTKSYQNSKISGRVIGNVVELTVPASVIGSSEAFNWTAAVREYPNGKGISANSISVSHKEPNHSHFSYLATNASSTPSVFQGSFNGNMEIDYPASASGTFSMTVYSDGSIEGSLLYNDQIYNNLLLSIGGQVDIDGQVWVIVISPSGSIAPPSKVVLFGLLSRSGNTLNISAFCTGPVGCTVSGTGSVSE